MPEIRNNVVHQLALVRRHRLELDLSATCGDLGDRRVNQAAQLDRASIARSADVENQAREATGLILHRDAGQILQRLHGLGHCETIEIFSSAGDRKVCAAACDRHVEVAVEICKIEQPLDVVCRKVTLGLEVVLRCRLGSFVQLIFAHDAYRHFFFLARFALTGC